MDPEAVERKLAAILSADVVGYSRLMAEDEEGTVRRLTAYREQVGLLVREHRGRVVDFRGDDFLAEFPTALDAVRCAVEIQRVLEGRNADLSPDRRMEFRIGAHLGDVRVEGERIYGDGVNIAARLEGLAEPGGICISSTVHEQVRHKLDLAYEDLGEQEVKNIPEPVRVLRVRMMVEKRRAVRPRVGPVLALAVAAVLLVVIGAWVLRGLATGSRVSPQAPAPARPASEEALTVPGFEGRPAIAVLPFDNLSGDPEQEYFADGLAEDLITQLSAWRSIPVIARNSSFVYKGSAVDVKQVSRDLGVRYLVEGSVRKADERVRVSAQLIDAATGAHVWAEQYDRDLRDIFALQDEITGRIIASMAPELERSERARVVREPPRRLDAWDTAQRAWWHYDKFSREENAKARALFERAIELDPQLSGAFSGLSMTHTMDVVYQWAGAPALSLSEALRAARRSVALDPKDAVAQLALGYAHMIGAEPDAGLAALKLAVQLNPSLALAHAALGAALARAGRVDDGIASLETAMRLSPQDPVAWMFWEGMAMAHVMAGRYEDAIHWATRAVERSPESALAYRFLAASYAHLGRLDEARAALEEGLRLTPGFSLTAARQLAASADPAFGERMIEGLRKAGLEE